MILEAVVARGHKRVTVNATFVSSILTRQNELIFIKINFSLWYQRKLWLENLAESGERSVLTLGSYPAYSAICGICCISQFYLNILPISLTDDSNLPNTSERECPLFKDKKHILDTYIQWLGSYRFKTVVGSFIFLQLIASAISLFRMQCECTHCHTS